MSEPTQKRKVRSGEEIETGKNEPSEIRSQAITPLQIQPPAIPDAMRDQLTALMQELLLKSHELSFEYSTMDCEDLAVCPLAKKSKELFRVVKKLNELVRSMTPTAKAY